LNKIFGRSNKIREEKRDSKGERRQGSLEKTKLAAATKRSIDAPKYFVTVTKYHSKNKTPVLGVKLYRG